LFIEEDYLLDKIGGPHPVAWPPPLVLCVLLVQCVWLVPFPMGMGYKPDAHWIQASYTQDTRGGVSEREVW
jgi:hypothetical protein